MTINKNVFIHEADKAALQTLKAIPGFTQVLRAFMRFWNEENMHMENMATKIKITEEQLPQYYNMLPPICDKLGIDIPELYLEMDWKPNAYTTGDTKAAITITSALLETIPEELLPSVLAHECGHIACHHVLYTTMGRWILNNTLSLLPVDIQRVVLTPVKVAFAYWMRCSEYSADRAAILCDGTPDKTFELCMRLAGYDKDIKYEANIDAFFKQAKEYKELINKNALNKAREIYQFYLLDHPVPSLRAYEANEWSKSEDFIKSKEYFASCEKGENPKAFPISFNEKHFLGRQYKDVKQELIELGFEEIDLIRDVERTLFSKDGSVVNVNIKGNNKYKNGDWVSISDEIDITYYSPLTDDEIAAMHPNMIKLPDSLKTYLGMPCSKVIETFKQLGFDYIVIDEVRDITKDKDRDLDKVASILIDKSPKYSKGDWIDNKAKIEITYHSKK